MNQHLLKVEMTPEKYDAITAGLIGPESRGAADYWQNIPEYLIARCPLCGATYSAQLDTYSLKYWLRPIYGRAVFHDRGQTIGCSHFVVVHHFINLNGVKPTEIDYKRLNCEVPHVIPVFLPDDIESYAVMHALPICRVEEERFVPRYSLYTITYYSEAPSVLIKRRWQLPPSEAMFIGRGLVKKDSWDLPKWVQVGKLYWLDPGLADLPLRIGPPEAFPYTNIQGHREDHNIYRHGEWEDWSFFARLKQVIKEKVKSRRR